MQPSSRRSDRGQQTTSEFARAEHAGQELGEVVQRPMLLVESDQPAPPWLRGGFGRQGLSEDLVEPVARNAEAVEAKEGAGGDRQDRYGVFGMTTQSVHTSSLRLPFLSSAATA